MTDNSSRPIRRPRGPLFKLQCDLVVPAHQDKVFPFFLETHNLDRITPPFLRFRVLTPRPIDVQAGTRLDERPLWQHQPGQLVRRNSAITGTSFASGSSRRKGQTWQRADRPGDVKQLGFGEDVRGEFRGSAFIDGL